MLDHLVLSVTAKCPAACKWCGAESGPRESARLSRDDMLGLIDEVYAYGRLCSVVFTGGEPLLLGNDLYAAISHCKAKGLWTRVVSNAYWAKTPAKATQIVARLMEAGLCEINFSCDDFHQEFVPLQNIRYANDACTSAGLPCLLGHKVMKGCALTVERVEEALGRPLSRFMQGRPNPKNDLISSGFTVPVQSSGMEDIADDELLFPEETPGDEHWKKPCSSIMQRVVVMPSKMLNICCGMISRAVPEIAYGPLGEKSLEECIIEAHENLIVNWLALEGPFGLMRFIQERAPEVQFRPRYVNVCHLCSEILTRRECREVLEKHGHEMALAVGLERGLYDLIREPAFVSASEDVTAVPT